MLDANVLKIINSDGIFTNLGMLLSDQCKHSIKTAVFQGTDQSIFRDRREFSGSLFKQLNDVYAYLDRYHQTKATFHKLLRIDTRDYPEVALREALLNLIVHRDYAFSASALISVYSDRMEFVSIGGLMPGIELDDVMLGISVCRNQNLANVFYEKDLGPLFMLASVLIVALQLPLARFARRVGAVRILPVGFLFLSAAFASVAMFAPTAPPEGWLRLLPSVCFVTLLTLGQMLLVPSAKDLVPRFAEESTLGAHYGALATAGGIAVLAGNLLFGSLLDRALVPSTQAMLPWLLLALFPLCSALALNVICRPLRS